MRKRYINIETNGIVETIDEFPIDTKEDRKELRRCFAEYLLWHNVKIWISQKCTKDWGTK